WSDPVAEGEGSGPSTRIALKPTPAKFVRITLTDSAADGAAWSIQKTRLFEAVKPSDVATQVPRVGKLPLAEVLDSASASKGDARRGQQLFTELSCVACHTVKSDEPPKGPFLGNLTNTYRRRELAEQILVPGKVIAKGYTTNVFAMKDGRQLEG